MPRPGLHARGDRAVDADDEHLGLAEGAHEQRAVRADDDVAQVAIERHRPRRRARRRGNETSSPPAHATCSRSVEPRRCRRRSRAAPPHTDRRAVTVAVSGSIVATAPPRRRTTCTRPAASSMRRPGSSPGCSARRAHGLVREVDEVDLVAIGIARHGGGAVREHEQRAAAERRHGRRRSRDAVGICGCGPPPLMGIVEGATATPLTHVEPLPAAASGRRAGGAGRVGHEGRRQMNPGRSCNARRRRRRRTGRSRAAEARAACTPRTQRRGGRLRLRG